VYDKGIIPVNSKIYVVWGAIFGISTKRIHHNAVVGDIKNITGGKKTITSFTLLKYI